MSNFFFQGWQVARVLNVVAFGIIFLSLEQRGFARSVHPAVPSSWVRLPEDSGLQRRTSLVEDEGMGEEFELPSPELDRAIGSIVRSTANSANRNLPEPIEEEKFVSELSLINRESLGWGARPGDWVPWHLEFFSTQLSLTTQGLIGLTTVKVQPSLTLNWRRQGSKPLLQALGVVPAPSGQEVPVGHSPQLREPTPVGPPASQTSEPDLRIIEANPLMTDAQILAEFEPALKSALATGRIRDPELFLKQTQSLLLELRNAALAVTEPSASEWWVCGVRFDFSVDATGKLLPFFSLGAEVRFRFEWRRMMPIQSPPQSFEGERTQWTLRQDSGQGTPFSPLAESLSRISHALVEDLKFAADDSTAPRGFQAQAFRVGLGISAKGEFGISKVGSTAIAHLNFTRDISRPIVYPVQTMSVIGDEELPLLESKPKEDSLIFARQLGVRTEVLSPSTLSWGVPQVLYRVPRARFRKGLSRALAMGRHLAQATQVLSSRSTWKIYELKAGVDLSMTGALGLATVGGVAMGEISFWNEEF